MSDLALQWSNTDGCADLVLDQNDLVTDDGLEPAVFASLFLYRRAEDGDDVPAAEQDRRGWWADSSDDRIGSRLWLLDRAKDNGSLLTRARDYAREALQWMVDDKVCARVEVVTERAIQSGSAEVLYLTVSVYRPERDLKKFRYSYNWLAQEAKRI